MGIAGSILTLNVGSSSLKFALFDAVGGSTAILRGAIEALDTEPYLHARDENGALLVEQRWPADSAHSFAGVLDKLLTFTDAHLGPGGLAAVGHRVVHGGADHVEPEQVTPALMAALERLIPFDPLHMPHNLAPIRAVLAARPTVAQVACFDTAFHHTMPLVAVRCAVPRAVSDAGVRRYGFHGLSYEYIAGRLKQQFPVLAQGRVIVAHLGSGASLCALKDGVSIATTMGFSALDGLVMATRCGNLDPGVILYLGQQGYSFAEIEDMLYRRSGLLGVSGISGDIRVLTASDDPHAHAAIELFNYRLAGEIACLVSALGGLDGLVFTAGIGEHSPEIRAAVCERLNWLGLQLDHTANEVGAARISMPESGVEIRIIATDEEAMIMSHTRSIVSRGASI